MAKNQSIEIDGQIFESLTAVGNCYGVDIKKLSRRIKSGWSLRQALNLDPPPKRKVTGRQLVTSRGSYKSVREASKASGVNSANISARLKLGWTPDQACGFASPPAKTSAVGQSVECDGKVYPSKSKLAYAYGLSEKLVLKRLRNNWTPEQAVGLTAPPPRYRNNDGTLREHSWVNPVITSDGKKHAGSSSGTYLLYAIENSINNKKYIGITTTSLSTRFYHHKKASEKSTSSSKLYNAMRRYGADNFSIRILRSDARNIEELLNQEIEAIKEHDTIARGYNAATGGTVGTSKPIFVDGIYFESRGQAADFFNIKSTVFNLRIGRLGWSPEEAAELVERPTHGRQNKTYELEIDNKTLSFPSVKQASEYCGIKPSTVQRRLGAGWSLEQALGIEPPPPRPKIKTGNIEITSQGESLTFVNRSEAARHFGIKPSTLNKRLADGWSLEEGLEIIPRRPKE